MFSVFVMFYEAIREESREKKTRAKGKKRKPTRGGDTASLAPAARTVSLTKYLFRFSFSSSSRKYNTQRPPCNAERVAELRTVCADDLCPASDGGGSGGAKADASSNDGSAPSLSSQSTEAATTAASAASAAADTAARLARKTKGGSVLSFAAPNPHIEHIISLICRLFDVEDALLALLDGERVYIRDAAGKKFRRGDFPWSCSFCGWSLANPTPQTLIVPDAREDARFDQNPFVSGPPYMRFYAGEEFRFFFSRYVFHFFFIFFLFLTLLDF